MKNNKLNRWINNSQIISSIKQQGIPLWGEKITQWPIQNHEIIAGPFGNTTPTGMLFSNYQKEQKNLYRSEQ